MKPREETGRYRIYFRIPFSIYFLCYDMTLRKYVLMRKVWNEEWCHYMWKKI
uniref:Uncharacterized protein n=1 Tax=viral metagenome TaxID=1070528 RepID=A0A6M3LT68_9ZZZZ